MKHEPCYCQDWKDSEPKLEEAVRIAERHGFIYTGKPFDFCSWCGRKLIPLPEMDTEAK